MGRQFDILLFVPLDEEFQEVIKFFVLGEDFSDELGTLCFSARLADSAYHFLLYKPRTFGNAEAQASINTLRAKFAFDAIICLGIGGGVSDDLRLLDVAVSSHIFDVSERTKIKGSTPEFDTDVFASPDHLVQRINFFKGHPNLQGALTDWQEKCLADYLSTIDAGDTEPLTALRRAGQIGDIPEFLSGAIASGPVVQSTPFKKHLKRIKRKMLAIDTESGGIFRSAESQPAIPAITIRGISDPADEDKTKLETRFKGAFRLVATRNAARFFVAQFTTNSFFTRQFEQLRSPALADKIAGQGENIDDFLERCVTDLTHEIEESLRKLSSEYRTKPRGYQLPVPRVRSRAQSTKDKRPLEPWNLLSGGRARVQFIDTPNTYPERSLPWIFADYYIKNGTKQAFILPFVIDGELIAPPNKGVQRQGLTNFDQLSAIPHISVVFIVSNIGKMSRNQIAFLEKEIDRHSEHRFLFIDDISSIDFYSGSTNRISKIERYSIEEVSFSTIARYVATHFEIDSGEAETIAYRLHRIFRKYNLSAHPSYFAGIPRDTLASLLNAQRRAELIDLAVSGYLTLSVIEDRNAVKLSATTRRRFLRGIALRTEYQKETLKQHDIVSAAQDMARENDFSIDCLDFVESFFRTGLLDARPDGIIAFTLPFMRSFLLAEELASQSTLALDYFSFDADVFDSDSFDLYCEIADPTAVYGRLVTGLQTRLSDVQNHNEQRGIDREIFLTNKFQPKLLSAAKQFSNMETSITKVGKELLNNGDHSVEKQNIIDAIDSARQQISDVRPLDAQGEIDANDFDSNIVFRDWNLGLIMLAAASEQLSGEQKRELASLLIDLGEAIVAHGTHMALNVDLNTIFERFKADIEQEFLDAPERGEIINFAEEMFGIAEIHVMTSSFVTVQNNLGEAARNAVLAPSVDAAIPKGRVGNLLKALWMLEIAMDKGGPYVKECLKEIPKYRLVRLTIAQCLITKAFWFHGKLSERRTLIDLAASTLKGLDVSIDKKEILEYLEEMVEENTT